MEITIKQTFDIIDIINNQSKENLKQILESILEYSEDLQDFVYDQYEYRFREKSEDQFWSEYQKQLDAEIEKAKNNELKIKILIYPSELKKIKSKRGFKIEIFGRVNGKYIAECDFYDTGYMIDFIKNFDFTYIEKYNPVIYDSLKKDIIIN